MADALVPSEQNPPSTPDGGGFSHPTLKDAIVAEVRERIFSGSLRPGTKIDQDQLSRELGVSRVPIREALISLERQGVVSNIARRGTYVAPLTRRDIQDHFALCGRVYALAAERACESLEPDTLRRLEELVECMEEAKGAQEFRKLDLEFHGLINAVGSSPWLRSIIDLLAESLPIRAYEATFEQRDVSQSHHRAILEALKVRDAKAVRDAMDRHKSSGSDYAVSFLEGQGFWDD